MYCAQTASVIVVVFIVATNAQIASLSVALEQSEGACAALRDAGQRSTADSEAEQKRLLELVQKHEEVGSGYILLFLYSLWLRYRVAGTHAQETQQALGRLAASEAASEAEVVSLRAAVESQQSTHEKVVRECVVLMARRDRICRRCWTRPWHGSRWQWRSRWQGKQRSVHTLCRPSCR